MIIIVVFHKAAQMRPDCLSVPQGGAVYMFSEISEIILHFGRLDANGVME